MSAKDFMSSTSSSLPSSLLSGTSFNDVVAGKTVDKVKEYLNPAGVSPTTTSGIPKFEKIDQSPYSHEGNNYPNVSAQSFETVNLNLQFQPNVLDNFDTVTYHFKLFITDPESSSTGQIFDPDNQTIIAESGVSDLTIDKVEVRSIATPTVEIGTGTSTHVKFEITEPSGAGLIDKLFYQSVALGIGNWAVMPVYLQLQFRARDPDTASTINGSPGSLASLKWIWRLKLTDIKANVTTVGTRYEFDAIIYSEFAQSNALFTLQHNTTLNNLKTFGDAMKDLQDKLNADQLIKLLSNYSVPDSFKIVVDPKIIGYQITPPEANTNSRRGDNFVEFGDKDASFSSGTAINNVIDSLLSNTNEYQEAMKKSTTPGADGVPMTQEGNQMKKIWRVITETRPLTFDPRRQTIANEFTIYVVDYDIGILDQNVFQTSAPPLTLEAERQRLMTYVQRSILKKKYNYIFTGLNDQILNFDVTINAGYAAAMSRFNGIYLNPVMSDKGVVNQDRAKQEIEVTEKVTKAIGLQNNAKSTNAADAQAAMEDAKNAIAAADISDDLKSRYTVLLEKSKPESRMNFLEDVRQAGGLNNDGKLNSSRADAQNLAKPVTEKISNKQYSFISDVDPQSKASKNAYTRYVEDTKGKLRPIARIETMQDRQIGMGVESNSNPGLQKISSLFSQALHSGLDSSFQRMRMTIKGDPFWLFPQPITDNDRQSYSIFKPADEAIDYIKRAHFKATDSVNIYGTDNFILVRFRTPRIYNLDDNDNNNDPNTDVETFSGVYKVIEITSRFEMGKFTQELLCNLDPEIRILNFIDQIEADARKQDIPTKPGDLVAERLPIPETAKSKDRIMGATETKLEQLASSTAGQINSAVSNIPTVIPSTLPQYKNLFKQG